MKNKKVIIPMILAVAAMASRILVSAGTVWATFCALFVTMAFQYATHHAKGKKELFIVGLVFTLGYVTMFLGYSPSFFIDLGVFLLSGVYIFIAFLLDRRFSGPDRGFLSTLVFPAVWTVLMNFAMQIQFGFQYRMDAFVTIFPAFNQLASIIGSEGILFLTMWTATVFVYAIEKRMAVSRIGIASWALVVIACFVFGTIRLGSASTDIGTVRIGYTTGPYVGDFNHAHELEYEPYAASLEKSAAAAAEGGAEMLVYNEEAMFLPDTREAEFKELVSSLAKEYHLHILTGEEIYDTDNSENGKRINRIRWTDPDGNEIFSYTKHSLVPIVESFEYVTGRDPIPVVDIPFACGTVKLAAIVCYDSNFSPYIAKIPNDTQMLFIPSWDWKRVTDYHGEVARELAIENGVTVVKDTYDGISYVFSPLGETLFETNTKDTGFENVIFADVPVRSRTTFYNLTGYYSAQVFTFITVAVLILLEIKKRKSGKGADK